MVLLTEHILFFLQISLMCLIISISGFLLKKIIFKIEDRNEFEENGLLGFIFIGFLALVINFFLPLNFLVNNILLSLIVLLALIHNFFRQNISKLITKILFVSIISYFFIIYSNVNRPDAFLYHLPYSKILNEHKVIVGLTNLHSRFGHISIFQYISSFFVNSIFFTKGLLIPISLVPSFFFIFCCKKIRLNLVKKKTRLNSYIIFLILIISIYSFSRYSGWGNDAQLHIFYFLTIIYFLDAHIDKKNLNLFYKLSITSIFTFLIKPFYLLSLFLPLFFFFKKKNKLNILISKSSLFLIIFLFSWIIKNFLVSSCFIYPINATCITNTSWYNENVDVVSSSGEAWSKDWINRENKSLNHNEFNKDFTWVKTWINNHFKKVLEKIFPVLAFIFFNILFFYFAKCLKINSNIKKNDKFFTILLLLNFFGVLLWFLKFPIFRYGLSYIYSFLIFMFYFIYIKYMDFNKILLLKKFFLITVVISFFGLFLKNTVRIYKTENFSIYPQIFEGNNQSQSVKYFNKNGKFIYFMNKDNLCGYTSSPCYHRYIELKKDNIFGYTIYKIIKNF